MEREAVFKIPHPVAVSPGDQGRGDWESLVYSAEEASVEWK
jgi:hypothetical protein